MGSTRFGGRDLPGRRTPLADRPDRGTTTPRARPIVAIDGPLASGKSTVAQSVAARLGFHYVDTGAMYRCVALAAIRSGLDLSDAGGAAALADSLSIEFREASAGRRVVLDGEDVTEAIRTPEVSEAASIVSLVPGVRATLVARQRRLGSSGGVVMEGRDIGTVVFPDADVKVFLQASLESRARRRFEELLARGVDVELEEVRRAQADRDRRDATRALSPMRPAADAVILDTTDRSVDEVVDVILRLVQDRTGVV
jgi:cytidylate kinase